MRAFDILIGRADKAEKTIDELEDVNRNYKLKFKKIKRKQTETFKNCCSVA